MNVATITMPPKEAEKKLKAFRANVHRQAESEYSAAIEGYEALAEGTPLVDLASVFRDCPLDAEGRPRLAVCRADRKEVKFRSRRDSVGSFLGGNSSQTELSETLNLQFDFGRKLDWIVAFAPVPMIPADKIPAKGSRKDWFILWEVDHWSERSRFAPPSRDPYLLKRIAGDLYAILAEWDLTDLELAIMSGAVGSR